jgi:hypothetical protein
MRDIYISEPTYYLKLWNLIYSNSEIWPTRSVLKRISQEILEVIIWNFHKYLFWYCFVFWTNKNDKSTIIVVNDWHIVVSLGQILHLLRKSTYIFTCNKIYEHFCGSEHRATFSVHFQPFFENFRPLVLKLSFAQNIAVFPQSGASNLVTMATTCVSKT